MKCSVMNSKGQVVIPQKLRMKYGIKPGTKMGFIEKNGELVLQPLTKDYFESLAEWLKGDAIGELMRRRKSNGNCDVKKFIG